MWISGTLRILASEQLIRYFDGRSGAGGRTTSDILCEDASVIEQVKPRNIILIVGGSDVRRATSPEEWTVNFAYLVSVVYNKFVLKKFFLDSFM